MNGIYVLSSRRGIVEQLLEQRHVLDPVLSRIQEALLLEKESRQYPPGEIQRLLACTEHLYKQIPYLVYHSIQQDRERTHVRIQYLHTNYVFGIRWIKKTE